MADRDVCRYKKTSGRKLASRTEDEKTRQLLLRCRAIRGARARPGAVPRPATGAVAIAVPFSVTVTFALTLTEAGAFGARTAIRAHAAVLFRTRRLPRGAFFFGLRRATITLAIPRTIARDAGPRHSSQQQSRCNQTTDHRAFHNLSFVQLCSLPFEDATTAPRFNRADHINMNGRPDRR